MDLKSRYQDDYILLGGLRKYVEDGVMLANVNFYRDGFQNYKEFEAIENRVSLLENKPAFLGSEFLVAFVNEEFPNIDDEIPESILDIAMTKIRNQEDEQTALITKQFLIEYAISIAKAAKEDWLSFIGLKDGVSDKEKEFIEKLESLFTQSE